MKLALQSLVPKCPSNLVVNSAALNFLIDALYYWYAKKEGIDYQSIERDGYRLHSVYQINHPDVMETLPMLTQLDFTSSKYYSPVYNNEDFQDGALREGAQPTGYYAWGVRYPIDGDPTLFNKMSGRYSSRLGLMVVAQAYIYGDKLYFDLRDNDSARGFAPIVASVCKDLGMPFDYLIEEKEYNNEEYAIMFEMTRNVHDTSRDLLYKTADEVKKELKDHGFHEGGVYLLVKRGSGRNITKFQDSSRRYASRTPESVSLVILEKLGEAGITLRVLPEEPTYPSDILSYRQYPADVRKSLPDMLDKVSETTTLQEDYTGIIVEDTPLTDADYILCHVKDDIQVPFDVVVWLGPQPEGLDDDIVNGYFNEDDLVLDPDGALVIRQLTESEMVRTVYSQRGYDIDWEAYDEEHDIARKWFMCELPKVTKYDINSYPLEYEEESLKEAADLDDESFGDVELPDDEDDESFGDSESLDDDAVDDSVEEDSSDDGEEF